MKNQKLLFNFPAFSSKEKYLIGNGPESGPHSPEAGQSNDAIESREVADEFRLFLLSNSKIIADISEENENHDGHKFNIKDYKFTISNSFSHETGGRYDGFQISIENSKHQVLEIIFTHGGKCTVRLNDIWLDEAKHPKDFSDIILKFQKIIAEAINKAIEKTRSTPESRLALHAGDKLFNFLNGESKKIEELKNFLGDEGINVIFKNGKVILTINGDDEGGLDIYLSKKEGYQIGYPTSEDNEVNTDYLRVTGEGYKGDQKLLKTKLERLLKLLQAALKRAAAKQKEFNQGIREF